MAEKLNIKADKLIGKKASIPKRFNIKNTPFAVYVNNNFIPNNYVKEMRKHCGKKYATAYMVKEYSWSKKTFNSIEWNLHSELICK